MKTEKTLLGKVEREEATYVEYYIERMYGLEELLMIVPDNDPKMKEDIETELPQIKSTIKEWWNKVSTKYNWPNYDNILWQIDFITCEVKIVNQCL